MERDIAARTFRFVPARQADQVRPRRDRRAVSSARSAARRASPAAARRALVEAPLAPRAPAVGDAHGGLGIAVLNGLVGDRLERDGSPLHQPIAVRVDGLPIAPERAALAQAFPAATPRLVVFLHGLMETERGWRLGGDARTTARGSPATSASRPSTSATTAAATSPRTGARSPTLLEPLVADWPVAVEEVALVGHSMGGLVSRSAAHIAEARRRWRGSSTCARWSRSARRTWARRSSRPCTTPPSGSAGCRRRACSARSCAAAARASATSARARSSTTTGASATPRRCAPRRARRCRCSTARRTASSPPPSRAARATRSAA